MTSPSTHVPSPSRIYSALFAWAYAQIPAGDALSVGTIGFGWARSAKLWRRRDVLSPETSTIGILFVPANEDRTRSPTDRLSIALGRGSDVDAQWAMDAAADALGALWARLASSPPVEIIVDGCPVVIADFHVLEWRQCGDRRLPLQLVARVTSAAFPLSPGHAGLIAVASSPRR